ncbi:MAG TPA: N-acetyltransferase [Noviherbaspirillum sp.]
MILTLPLFSWPSFSWPLRARPLALRIDVELPDDSIENELEALHRRLQERGTELATLEAIAPQHDGLVFRYREADGEHYVYVEDTVNKRLAGYTVFNRLVEVDRTADRHLRAPHSRYASVYQRRGLATAVYCWWLDAGQCLITGARQSSPAHALWRRLAARYDMVFVDVRDKTLTLLGRDVDAAVREDLHTRMLLLGRGQCLAALAARIGMHTNGQEVGACVAGPDCTECVPT